MQAVSKDQAFIVCEGECLDSRGFEQATVLKLKNYFCYQQVITSLSLSIYRPALSSSHNYHNEMIPPMQLPVVRKDL